MKKILLIISILAFTFSYAVEVKKKENVKIGVLAKRGVAKAVQKWGPTSDYLNKLYPHYNFIIVPMKFDDISLLVKNSLIDFVIVNSGIYVDLNVKYGVNRISTLKNQLDSQNDITKFGSVVFTKKDSDISTFKDLKDKRVAAVHKTSFGGWIMAKRDIEEQNVCIDEFKKLNFLNTHDNVVLSVLNGENDVGIVRTDTLERMNNEKKIDINKLKVINKKEYKDFPFFASSRLYPEWPVAKLLHTNNKVAKELTLALMTMKPDSYAAKASNIRGWTIPENYSSVHDILKKLNISPYENYGKITLKSVFMQYWKWVVFILLSIGGMIIVTLYSLKLNRDLKKQQSKLVRNEEMFRSTFDQAGIGIIHITFDGDFRRVNQQFCQMIKTSCIETKKENFSDYIYSSDLSQIIKTIEKLKNYDERTAELTIRLNTSKDETIWAVITLSKVVEMGDSEPYIVATIIDVSHMKKLESKINHERSQKNIILDNAGDGILGLDKFAKHTFVNTAAAELLGYEVEEMIDQDSHKMWHHSHNDGTHFPNEECPITSVLKNGITHRGHNEVFWTNKKTKLIVDFISTPIIENHEIVGAVIIFRESDPNYGQMK